MTSRIRRLAGLALAIVAAHAIVPGRSSAQGVDGYVSLMTDVLPAVRLESGQRHAIGELRARVLLERRVEIADGLRLTVAGFAEGLVADRAQATGTTAGIVRPQELHFEAVWPHADLRAGLSRVVWGRLDEFLPTDVVNPQDLARFFFEGRSEGRMPVGMVRGRLLPSDRVAIEVIYVPVFRRGRFDQLDPDTSPFNIQPRSACLASPLLPCVLLDVLSDAPPRILASAQGGVRASVTTGRVDWSASVYRGYESLPLYEVDGGARAPDAEATGPAMPVLVERFPRFTMVGGDFETVRGTWGVRGEAAAFFERTLQSVDLPALSRGRAFEAGLGVDRRSGAYRVSGSVVFTKRWSHDSAATNEDPLAAVDREDLTMVAAVDRSFAQEARAVRLFAVYNPTEASAFTRVMTTFSLRDNLSLEMSGGVFVGSGSDALSRLASRDFVYARLKVFY